MDSRIQIDRFVVKNFRSIRECDVELAALTFFIGANGSGKTSFVDAILFVASALRDSLQKAIASRGGIHSILRQPIILPTISQFDFYLSSASGFKCEFQLELRIVDGWSISIAREECRIVDETGVHHNYRVENGKVTGSASVFPAVSVDRIFLANASGLPEYRLVFDFITGISATQPTMPAVYEFVERFKERPGTGRDETGLAARIRGLKKTYPDRLELIQQYLRAIAPFFDQLDVVELNNNLFLRFVEKTQSDSVGPFYISQTSAGLVNSTEILLELFEPPQAGRPASLVIIEEPEALLHPGAVQVIRDSFIEASRIRQVLVTTHSPELLDDHSIPAEWIRAVHRDEVGTHIDVLDSATKSIIRDRLYTAGELLRQGGLLSGG